MEPVYFVKLLQGVINKALLLLWLRNGLPFGNQTQRNKRRLADDFFRKGRLLFLTELYKTKVLDPL
jgi:hypothetical protein